jgi:hypothetical protein
MSALERSKTYIENLLTATSQVKTNPKGRRPAILMAKDGEQSEYQLDEELIEKTLIEIGESTSRGNSTMATEEDEEDDESPNEEEEEELKI